MNSHTHVNENKHIRRHIQSVHIHYHTPLNIYLARLPYKITEWIAIFVIAKLTHSVKNNNGLDLHIHSISIVRSDSRQSYSGTSYTLHEWTAESIDCFCPDESSVFIICVIRSYLRFLINGSISMRRFDILLNLFSHWFSLAPKKKNRIYIQIRHRKLRVVHECVSQMSWQTRRPKMPENNICSRFLFNFCNQLKYGMCLIPWRSVRTYMCYIERLDKSSMLTILYRHDGRLSMCVCVFVCMHNVCMYAKRGECASASTFGLTTVRSARLLFVSVVFVISGASGHRLKFDLVD